MMKEKILIVNDDDGVREMSQIILQLQGYEVIEAINGRMGIEEAMKTKPDLILLDIMMPEMDGFEACRRLKADPITKDIPILFFSSLTNPKDKVKGLELGAVDFINNVVDQGEFLARVQTHLKIQSLTQALKNSNEHLIQKQKALDHDLRTAAVIQRSFLPSPTLKIPSLEVASVWIPANTLGGDIFNIIQCGQDDQCKMIFYMVDVSGHDVPSALVTISVSQYLHQQNTSSTSFLTPKQMMKALDNEYPIERFDRYFTIFYLVLDIPTATLSYSSAGHPPAILLSKHQDLKILDIGGTIIGLNRSLPFDEGIEKLHQGDKIVLYTDGVVEATNPDGEWYGTERFYSLLEKIKNRPAEEIVNAIETSLNEFRKGLSLQDDTSIMCFEFQGGN